MRNLTGLPIKRKRTENTLLENEKKMKN